MRVLEIEDLKGRLSWFERSWREDNAQNLPPGRAVEKGVHEMARPPLLSTEDSGKDGWNP
jgi:hypothetical protein